MTGAGNDAVAVFRAQLLPGSETFIRDQADALTRWRPVTFGALRVDSPLSRPDDTVLYDAAGPGDQRRFADRVALLLAELTGVAPRVTRHLRRLRDERGVRVVHAHFAKDAWLVARAARRAGLPLVVTCHGYDVTSLPGRPGIRGAGYRWRTRRVLGRADAVVAVSGFIADAARKLGAADPVVVHTGVRVDRAVVPSAAASESSDGAGISEPFSGAGDPVGGAEPIDVLFVGRLVPKKGVDDLLRAIPGVAEALGRRVRVHVIGDGPLAPELKGLAEGLGIADSVVFEGARPTARVDAAMASARVFCGPSRTAPDGDSEGFGQVFLEAALAGTPAVARRHGGVVEAVEHGVSGLLSEPGDAAALERDLLRLLGDDGYRAAMGEAARRRAEDRFDMARCVVRLEELYSAVARPPRSVR